MVIIASGHVLFRPGVVGLCPEPIPVPAGELVRLVLKCLCQRIHLAEELRHLLRQATDVAILGLDQVH